jgi:hypothetical protein
MPPNTEINKLSVRAELTALHEKYEKALLGNDVAALASLFWNSPHAVRYGTTENLYGAPEINAFRQGRPNLNLARTVERLEITTFGDSVGIVNLEFKRDIDGVPRHGRQTQIWMKLAGDWKIVSAHVSLMGMPASYVDVVAANIGLPIAAADHASVEEEFKRISEVAQVMLRFPLDQTVEAAATFQP